MHSMPRTAEELQRITESLGPAEKMLQLIINFPDHLWHNRPGVVNQGRWKPATSREIRQYQAEGKLNRGEFRPAGPNVEAIAKVYQTLAEIWEANNELAARLASYIMRETDWRDMKVVCAAFMLVQSRAGQPVTDVVDGRREVLFEDEDYRRIGEAMIKWYQRGSSRMMTPKLIRRIGQVLALPQVVAVNKRLQFGHPHKRRPFSGRYYKSVQDWLAFRESNPALLEGLQKSGYAGTVKHLSRMVGYKPQSQRFFEVLGWKQKQHAEGHRTIGLDGLQIRKVSFDGLSEEAICQTIQAERLGWKKVMGLLPRQTGLTPAIMVSLLDQFSDKDLTILTPTLEEFGLLKHEPIRQRWQEAIRNQEDQRARNIARNLRDRDRARDLEASADQVVARTVEAATRDRDIFIMFIIDVSASMQGAIESSKEALAMIVQGFPQDRVHISCFNTVGTILKPRHYSGAGVQHMLKGIRASGGTVYSAGVAVFQYNGVRIPEDADLILVAVGDEMGEDGASFAHNIRHFGYQPKAIAHIVSVAEPSWRGQTVRNAAETLRVPYTEVEVNQFTDVYQVQRTLKAVLEAQPYRGQVSLVEKIMQTPLVEAPY